MRPYIGITGFMNDTEIEAVASGYDGAHRDPFIMAGILVSSKTFLGKSNKWPNRYPDFHAIRTMLAYGKSADLRDIDFYIHYNTDCRDERLLFELLALVGAYPSITGLQLNIAWPDPKVLHAFADMTADRYRIILQIGIGAMSDIGFDPQILVSRLNSYIPSVPVIDYVLLDPSGGYGKPMDVQMAEKYLDQIYAKDLHKRFGIGIAGGLCAENVAGIASLIKKFPGLCIDAEGKLRDGDDRLSVRSAVNYANKALELYRQAREK
jgi:hypothetical protein